MDKGKGQRARWIAILLFTHALVAAGAGYVAGTIGYMSGFNRGWIVTQVPEGANAVRIIESLNRGSTDLALSDRESAVDQALTAYVMHKDGLDKHFAPPWLDADFLDKAMPLIIAYRREHPTPSTAKILRDAVASDLRRASAHLSGTAQ